MHYFNGLQQKEITIYKKSNIKTALNYIQQMIRVLAAGNNLKVKNARQPEVRKDI